jgi:hypothetical protein
LARHSAVIRQFGDRLPFSGSRDVRRRTITPASTERHCRLKKRRPFASPSGQSLRQSDPDGQDPVSNQLHRLLFISWPHNPANLGFGPYYGILKFVDAV